MAQTIDFINGVNNPAIGTVAISDSGTSLTVTAIYRYNNNGGFVCGVKDVGTFFGTMEVYWDTANNRFGAREYKAERHRDKDGVEKGL